MSKSFLLSFISILNENIKGLEAEEVTLIEAVKRVLAEDIYSKIDNPPFDKSAMDGYAVIANDSNSNEKINVIDKVFAGDICTSEVVEKTAIRIMTGAPIPKGANAVVKQEDVILDNDGYITLTKTLKENENICFKGEDIQKGTLLVKKNKRLETRLEQPKKNLV